VAQLRTFLQLAARDRFFALWVLEATSGMRRCGLAGARRDGLDLDAGTLSLEATRVVIDGAAHAANGKTENAQHVIAIDPYTLAVLRRFSDQLDQERADFGRTIRITGCCSAGRTAGRRIRTRSRDGLTSSASQPGCQRSGCMTSATATPRQGKGAELHQMHHPPAGVRSA
jgi:hypothetical protein